MENFNVVRYVVVEGNPIDGISLIGPFTTMEEAEEYVRLKDMEWWITPMWGPL